MNTENLSTLKIHKLTKAQYERELAAGRIDPNAMYLTPDEEIDLSSYATIESSESYTNDAMTAHNTATDVHSNMGWLTSKDIVASEPAPINADTLNGYDARHFDDQIAVERARIDQFVALPEGSTTGDAELQDIRVGFDGTIYETAGEAVRAQVCKLHQDIEANAAKEEFLKDGTVNIVLSADDSTGDGDTGDVAAYSTGNTTEPTDITNTLTWTENTYITFEGDFLTADSFRYSNLITLNKGETIRVTAAGGSLSVAVISKWSNDGNTFLACIHQTSAEKLVETVEHTATETEYLRICYQKYWTTKDGGALLVETFYSGIEEPEEPEVPDDPDIPAGVEVSQINGRNLADKTARQAVEELRSTVENNKSTEVIEEVLEDGTVNIVLSADDNTGDDDTGDVVEVTNITDTLTWTENTYINIEGVFKTADGFHYSNLITLNKGEAIRVTASVGGAYAMLSKWSSDGNTFIACVYQGTGTAVETVEHIATETEYLRVCYQKYWTTKDGGALVVETFYAGIEEPDEPGIPEAPTGTEVSQINGMNLADKWARQAIKAIYESENNSADVSIEPLDDGTVNIDFGIADEPKTNITDTLTWTENTYINIEGVFKTADSFCYSNLITLNKGEAIRVTASAGGAAALISKWSSDGSTFLACVHQAQGTAVETVEHIATETEYLRISYNKYFTTKDGGALVVETYVVIKPEVSQIDDRQIVDTEARAIIADLTAEVERLLNINNPLTGKTIVVDGDSITYGQGNNQNGTYTGWADIIATQNGMTLSKFAKSGATLTSGSNSICDRVSTLTEADYIIISGGYNDYANDLEIGELTNFGFRIGTDTIDTFRASQTLENGTITEFTMTLDKTKVIDAVEYIVRYLLATYPTKKLGFVFTHKVGAQWYSPASSSKTRTLKEYHDAILSVLEKYSFPYCDLTQISRFNTGTPTYAANYTNNGDAIHPNQAGYEIGYVPQITAWLKTL